MTRREIREVTDMPADSPFHGSADDFTDDGLVPRSPLPAYGEVRRPNGTLYRPRTIHELEDVALLRDIRAHGEHALFYGPPGTGKTAFVEAAFHMDATSHHTGFETVIGGLDTTEGNFFGTFMQNPHTRAFEWVDGPLLRALRHNIPLYVDEIFLIDTRVLASVLYPVMDGRKQLPVTINPALGSVPVPDRFTIVASGNPDAPGADYSEALRSRFDHQIELTSDWKLARALGVPADITRLAKALDAERRKGAISWSPQTRDLLSYTRALDRYGRPYAAAKLLGMAPFEDRDHIAAALTPVFGKVTALAVGGPAPAPQRPHPTHG